MKLGECKQKLGKSPRGNPDAFNASEFAMSVLLTRIAKFCHKVLTIFER